MSIWDRLSGSGYMPSYVCLRHDWPLIACLIVTNLGIVAGYWIIARDWWRHSRLTPDSGGKLAMSRLIWIFLLCGIAGYLLPVVFMFWPVWWLSVAVKAGLIVLTWKYVFGTGGLRIVFREMSERAKLEKKLGAVITDIESHAEPDEAAETKLMMSRIKTAMQRTGETVDLMLSERRG